MPLYEFEIFDFFVSDFESQCHSCSFDVEEVWTEVVSDYTCTLWDWFTYVLGLFGDFAEGEIVIVVADFKIYEFYIIDICGEGTEELFCWFG
jgi:hypothetical protein